MTLTVESHDSTMQVAGETLNGLINSFGFYPENSLIIRWLKHEEVVLVQRCDIAAFMTPQNLGQLDLEIYLEPGRAYSAEEAALVVCLESMDSQINAVIEAVESAIVNVGIRLGDVFIAVGQRMYSRECIGGCDAHSIPQDIRVKREDRALECATNASQAIDVKEFPELPKPKELGVWRETESKYVQELMKRAGDAFLVSELARLSVALGDIRVRDSILWDMANGTYDRSSLAKKLTHGLPQLQATHGAPIATAAAICWWLNGNGAMANLCLDRAFTDAPDYSLAAMVRAALDHALPPEFWLESINELTREQCLAGLDVAPEIQCGYSSV
jgi:hypothetical protein